MKPRKILIIDYQEDWRRRIAEMLQTSDYVIETFGGYNYPVDQIKPGQEPDLVILSCSHITGAELRLVEQMLTKNLTVVVLSTSIPWAKMRRVFLAGAEDVTDKPYTQKHLINIVETALQNAKPVDSYEAMQREVMDQWTSVQDAF
ncbi:MAG: response regulator [Anaerolineae bacterium]|nr:response regulator [Anaerolineae bacterium]